MIGKKHPLRLSFGVFRHGTKSLQCATTQETTKCLNKVGHFCLNICATTAVVLTLVALLNSDSDRNTRVDFAFLLLSICMWAQLAAARNRTIIPLIVSLIIDLTIFGLVVYEIISSLFFSTDRITPISEYVVAAIWLVLILLRFISSFILYKVLTVKNPQFALSTTVFLKPTNTPVTFSSVLAPQDLDPTNPYHSQTVYNINHSQGGHLNKTVA